MFLLLLCGGRAAAQSAVLAGNDTAEASQPKGLPWIAHSSAEAFYLASHPDASGSRPYQVSAYQGFTIQSLAFASFHAGWRYRETLAPGLGTPYREPFSLKLQGTAEILRDHLFVTLGGSIPLAESRAGEEDTLALHRATSGYSPLPAPNFLVSQGMQVGVTGRYRLGAWDLMSAFAYSQPTQTEHVDGHPFNPASYFTLAFRAGLETRSSSHRWDAKVARFGTEATTADADAHREGALYQLRYAWLRASGRSAWQLGTGFAVKAPDSNRVVRLRTSLEAAEGNDNVQRAYAEAAWTWRTGPKVLWRVHLAPKALLEWSTREGGHETELGLGMGLRLWDVHRLRSTGTLLAGSFKGEDYLGFGLRIEFAFRHLGIQDLEPERENGG
jgi:hypothetical protein